MAHVTVPAEDPAITYTVTTPQTVFTIPSYVVFWAEADLRVYSVVDDVYTEIPSTGWSFTGSYEGGYAGGELTLAVAVEDCDLRLYRSTEIGRSTDFPEGGPLDRSVLNTQVDQLAAQIVDAYWRGQRALRAPDYVAAVDAFDLAANPGKIIGVNGTGDGFEAFNVPVTGVSLSTQAQAEAGANDTTVMTPLRARQGMKTAALTPDVDSDGFYNGSSGAGFFVDYNCLGGAVWRPDLSASQASISGGGIRDGFAILARDTDTTDYTAIGRKISNGARILITGAYDAGTDTWGAQVGKDIIGLDVHAIANVSGPDRGVSGIAAGSINYGTGIISHEFSVENPAAGSQSVSMAAVQGIIRPYNAADDGSHVYQAFLATNTGHRVTAGLRLTSTPISGSYNGRFRYGVDMTAASIEECALRLRGTSAVGHAATVIEYDGNDYTYYDRGNDRYAFVIGGAVPFQVYANGFSLPALGAPASPANQNFWSDGTDVFVRLGGTTYKFSKTPA